MTPCVDDSGFRLKLIPKKTKNKTKQKPIRLEHVIHCEMTELMFDLNFVLNCPVEVLLSRLHLFHVSLLHCRTQGSVVLKPSSVSHKDWTLKKNVLWNSP